ncbi:Uncharacterized protein TCM_023171 [Theobroma cacao]|uniref:Uncharacterized protein n=1 Tax=Theobroma cacao TaxID=3641 RepID=A0A061EVY8_THECC|nr:Uncharacterized protein TCM_023171 [Theobroma cacao]
MDRKYYERLVTTFYLNATTIFKDNPTHDEEEEYAHEDMFVTSVMGKDIHINIDMISHILYVFNLGEATNEENSDNRDGEPLVALTIMGDTSFFQSLEPRLMAHICTSTKLIISSIEELRGCVNPLERDVETLAQLRDIDAFLPITLVNPPTMSSTQANPSTNPNTLVYPFDPLTSPMDPSLDLSP